MPIYRYTKDGIDPVPVTSFQIAGVKERDDLQRLLREDIGIVSPDTLIISEEFGDWEDSRRRIDLLGVHSSGDLVVIELKRTDDGGHMELQALRYAAMVSAMTFERAVEVYSRFLQTRNEHQRDAEATLRAHIESDGDNAEETFGADTQIVLVSADFSRELTTAVLWLSNRGLPIRCVRLQPYDDSGNLLLNVEQVIPLPEAEEYQVSLRRKETEKRAGKTDRQQKNYRFWQLLTQRAANKSTLLQSIKPGSKDHLGTSSRFGGCRLNYVMQVQGPLLHLWIDAGESSHKSNRAIFQRLYENKEHIEEKCGHSLVWDIKDDRRACVIKWVLEADGINSPESNWPAIADQMIDAMEKFEDALSLHFD